VLFYAECLDDIKKWTNYYTMHRLSAIYLAGGFLVHPVHYSKPV